MLGFTSFILGMVILAAIFVAGGVILWFVFGRRKQGEDRAIGVLEEMAIFRAPTGSTNSKTR